MLRRRFRFLLMTLLLAASAVALPPVETATAETLTLTGEQLAAGDQFPGSTLTFTCSASDPNTVTFRASGFATGPYPGTFTEQGSLTRDPATGQFTFNATFEIRSFGGTVTGTKTAANFGIGTIGCPGPPMVYTAGGPVVVSYTARIETADGAFTDQGSSGVGLCWQCGFADALLGETFISEQACAVEALAASTASADSDRRGRLDPAPFRRLRDQVLARSPGGQRYVRLYETHSPEIVRLLLADPNLRTELVDGLRLWQADLTALADGRGGSATIDAEQVRAAETVLDRLAAKGSPALRRAIEQERRAHPPAGFVGMPLDRALDELTRGQAGR